MGKTDVTLGGPVSGRRHHIKLRRARRWVRKARAPVIVIMVAIAVGIVLVRVLEG